MPLHAFDRVEWKDWFALSDSQNAAVEHAIQKAGESEEILRALEHDLALLVNGSGKLDTPEDKCRKLYGEALFRMHPVLILIMRLPWLVEQYRAHGIGEKVLKDTLSDVKIWMDVCERKTGIPGLMEYGWLSNHFSFRLFRLGRLQFISQPNTIPAYVYRHGASGVVMALCPNGDSYQQDGEGAGCHGASLDNTWQATLTEEGGRAEGFPIHPCGLAMKRRVTLDLNEWKLVLKPGDPVLDMHIAEGCPLDMESVSQSLSMAPDFFKKYLGVKEVGALTCSSWLLDHNIGQMQPHGNIARFQQRFHLVPHSNSSEWQTKQRVFGDPDVDILTAECHTSLQRAISAWYAAGRRCRHAAGFILL